LQDEFPEVAGMVETPVPAEIKNIKLAKLRFASHVLWKKQEQEKEAQRRREEREE
jgi:hypothetical protein